MGGGGARPGVANGVLEPLLFYLRFITSVEGSVVLQLLHSSEKFIWKLRDRFITMVVYAIEPKVTNNSMEQVQIADQTGELLGKTRVSRQFWPRVLPNANHAEPRPHHASGGGGGGGDSTKVAPAAASDSSSSEVRAGHRHKQLRIAVIHPHLRIGNVSLSLLAIAFSLGSI
jgi:hypothetical protein